MRYFSTFTGIGGFEIGIHEAWTTTYMQSKAKQLSLDADKCSDNSDLLQRTPSCVGYSEIDKYASSVYERHYPNVRNYGDITKINADELPDFDVLVGGFPCQAFSIAGKRRGFEDTRGTLFFDLARILKAKTPRLFVFENVKGLLSHDSGATFKTIIAATSELGYDCQWQVLNSKNHGVPQNRERIIIVGHLRGTPRPQVFPIVGDNQETANEVTSKGQIVDLTRREPTSYRERKDGRAGTLDANYYKGLANQERPGVLDGARIRKLTPVECERLQAFPDNWTKWGIHIEPCSQHETRNIDCLFCMAPVAISDTQRYKMCGNAVTTNVIRDVFERILAC